MICQYCSKPAKSLNSKIQHEIRCVNNPTRLDMSYNKFNFKNPTILPTPCIHCEKIYETKIALSNHVRRCPKNPNRIMEVLTETGRAKIKQTTIEQNKRQWQDTPTREKHRQSMRQAVENNPESYTSSNRGRTKQIIVDGIKLQGQWEVDFYLWAKENGLDPKRPNKSFTYEWNGTRTYFPDFYIESKDLYVEVKGYETDRDRAKWLHFPEKLRIIKEAEIKQIRQGIFVDL
jgi:hypothetical protein